MAQRAWPVTHIDRLTSEVSQQRASIFVSKFGKLTGIRSPILSR